MPSNRRSKRRAFIGRSKSNGSQFTGIKTLLSNILNFNDQYQRRRRQRQQRQFNSHTPKQAAALLMRHGATFLLIFIAISMLLNSIPIQLFSPGWYLRPISYLADKVPEIIVISLLSISSIVLSSDNESNRKYFNSVAKVSRIAYVSALLILAVQIALSGLVFSEFFANQSNQIKTLRTNADALVSLADQIQSNDEFVAFLKSRNITANYASIASTPLVRVKSEFSRSMQSIRQKQEQTFNANSRMTIMGLIINTIKLNFTLFILAGFLYIFQASVKSLRLRSLESKDVSRSLETLAL